MLKNSLSFCDSTRTLTSSELRFCPGQTPHSCVRRSGPLDDPTLDDRIPRVHRLMRPDQAGDARPRCVNALGDLAKEVADLGDLLTVLDLLADPDLEA